MLEEQEAKKLKLEKGEEAWGWLPVKGELVSVMGSTREFSRALT